jgi:hypothetical protein
VGAVTTAELPASALLGRYALPGGHVDCYAARLVKAVSLPQLISAFYASRAFRPERWLIGSLLGKSADDHDVARLASGETAVFSAWTVEAREADQILLCDFRGATRSWLMVEAQADGGTIVRFGSAVVPSARAIDIFLMRALMGFHRLYSRILLGSALARL